MNDLQAVYIRHNMASTPEILEDLWANRQIAIHYEDLRSINPDDYKARGKNALRRLHRYCESGVMVGVACRRIRKASMLVGILPKGSKIKWIDKYGEQYIYKVVTLENTSVISYIDYPLLAAIQPRYATITKWDKARDTLEAAINGMEIIPNVNSLAPSQLEVICYEYLRMKGILKALLLPIGRNLQNIDIFGIGDEGKIIVAQVTHGAYQEKTNEKLNTLKEYNRNNTTLIFFGPGSHKISDPIVRYIPIEDVFGVLYSPGAKTIYNQMIEKMFKFIY
jgi:hypothetical protein